jgi:hypothetical protein
LPPDAVGEVNLLGVSETSPTSAVIVGLKFEVYGFLSFHLIESHGVLH